MPDGNDVIAGCPAFWQMAHDSGPDFYKHALALMPLENWIFSQAVSEPLQKVLRQSARTISNSSEELITPSTAMGMR